jgi:hypothetical protein
MRLASIGLFASSVMLCMTAANASPPISNELMLPLSGKVSSYINPDDNGGGIPTIGRGKLLGVACADVNRAGADVRVVMSLTPGEEPAGYSGVLATSQKITPGTVHIRVPDLPELAQHTVSVKVYVVDAHGTHTCDAGRVRIV